MSFWKNFCNFHVENLSQYWEIPILHHNNPNWGDLSIYAFRTRLCMRSQLKFANTDAETISFVHSGHQFVGTIPEQIEPLQWLHIVQQIKLVDWLQHRVVNPLLLPSSLFPLSIMVPNWLSSSQWWSIVHNCCGWHRKWGRWSGQGFLQSVTFPRSHETNGRANYGGNRSSRVAIMGDTTWSAEQNIGTSFLASLIRDSRSPLIGDMLIVSIAWSFLQVSIVVDF